MSPTIGIARFTEINGELDELSGFADFHLRRFAKDEWRIKLGGAHFTIGPAGAVPHDYPTWGDAIEAFLRGGVEP